ncbi:hypothetical protein TASIC1_0017002200 [Trichoderma asperellum]|uniref:Uncharacterized protein n=1 Tax=Trichoderma asperellum TaxID=101201 RepID=A0A6V8R6L5_TRIAP|nr:hypothetical protein TASIC1_0017002200 [Trichoderma asperellum]
MASSAERRELDEELQPAPDGEQVLEHPPSGRSSSDRSHGSPTLMELSTSASGSSGHGALHFVNMSHPEDIRRQSNVQREIRRHVMKGNSRRPAHPESPSPSRSLAPLGSFPVQTNMRMLELVRFANEVTDFYVPFRVAWWEVALMDPGAFYVTLGNSADFWRRLNTNDIMAKTPEIMRHYSQSLIELRRRLDDDFERTKPGTIANILAHVCLNMRHCDWNSWRVHIDGLDLVLKARGGFDSLPYQMVVLTLYYDICGAMVFDSPPRFSVAPGLVTANSSIRAAPPRLQTILLQLQQMPPDISIAANALQKISDIADIVNLNSHSAAFWKKDVDAILLIGPPMHYLLSMPRLPTEFATLPGAGDLVVRELIRLVCVLIMSAVKERFTFFTVERGTIQAKLAQFIASNLQYIGSEYREIKIWALITAALLEERTMRELYLIKLEEEALASQNSSESLVNIAREIIWLDCLESSGSDELVHDMDFAFGS